MPAPTITANDTHAFRDNPNSRNVVSVRINSNKNRPTAYNPR